MSNHQSQTRLGAVLRVLAALVLALGLLAAAPSPAYALSTDKATARPNSQSCDELIGGRATLLTW